MAYLVLVRHGMSEWNIKGLWTGWTDVPLVEQGIEEARKAGENIKGIHFDQGFTSKLIRAQQTMNEIKHLIGQDSLPVEENLALNERNYGELTGKNKWDVQKQYGEEQFQKWRRGWDCPIPGGETLKDVYNRVAPYYENHILPVLKQGKNILVTASHNSLRALVKLLENVPEEQIPSLEITTGEVYVYEIDTTGKILSKEIKNTNTTKV